VFDDLENVDSESAQVSTIILRIGRVKFDLAAGQRFCQDIQNVCDAVGAEPVVEQRDNDRLGIYLQQSTFVKHKEMHRGAGYTIVGSQLSNELSK